MSDIENKLATARTRLILDKPFLGALVLRLPMVEGDASWCETTYSDGKTFYYNSDYIDALDIDQTQFALSHEALHCALSHFYRRGHRVKHRWELACDYAVNPLLINDGLKPTPDAAHLREYEGMTAEEIYPCLEDNDNDGERDLERNKDSSNDDQDKDDEENKDMSDGGSDKERQKNDAQNGSGNETEESDGSGAKGAPKPNPLSPQQQEDLSTRIVRQGCRYAVCAGVGCSSWDDAIDMVLVMDEIDGRPGPFVMTTWHEDESIQDVAEYFALNTRFDDWVPERFVVLVVGGASELEVKVRAAVEEAFRAGSA